jgi:ADP-heptose:LPS heptosyltransferase
MVSLKKKTKHIPGKITLRDFHSKKDKILIWNKLGGLGDIFIQRMLFKDIQSYFPDCELIFACPPEFMDAAKSHKFISKILNSKEIDINDYGFYCDTCVSIVHRYEQTYGSKKNRSDIWAEMFGVTLTEHEMYLDLDNEKKNLAKKELEQITGKKINIAFCPVSRMLTKTLLPWQIEEIVNFVKQYNYGIVGLHKTEIQKLTELNIHTIYNKSVEQWMYYIAAADYVISVDSAALHLAGGLKKPVVGIFTFADGKIYGKYYPTMTLVQLHKDDGDWDCGPCYTFEKCPKCTSTIKPCLTELTAERIQQGIKKCLNLEKIFPGA